MTVTTLPPSSTAVPALSPAARRAIAGVAVLGPLCMAGWAIATPIALDSTIPQAAASLAAQPGPAAISLLFVFLAGLFGAAGSLVVAAVVRRGAPRFGAVAGVVAFIGYCAATYPGPVAAIAASSAADMSSDQVLQLVAAVDAQPLGVLSQILFIGVPAGILLLGIAAVLAARRGRLPVWVAVLLAASTPAIILGGFLSMTTLVLGWVLTAVAYGAAGWVYATSDR